MKMKQATLAGLTLTTMMITQIDMVQAQPHPETQKTLITIERASTDQMDVATAQRTGCCDPKD